jgi:hypothetical protein
MNLFNFKIDLKSRGDEFTIIPLYDIHYGNALCDVEALKRTVEKIRTTPNCYWFGGGDMCDCINLSDPRFDPRSVILDPKALDNLVYTQVNELANILLPIKTQGMFLLEGNHEIKVKKKYHMNPIEIIGGMLKIKAYGYSAYGNIKVKRNGGQGKIIKIFAGHGWGAGRKIGSKINRLIEMGEFITADIIYGGHSHGLIVDSAPNFDLTDSEEPQLKAEQRFVILGGTFLKTYDTNKNGHSSYGEEAGYKPTPIGTVETVIKPFAQKVMPNGKNQEIVKIQVNVNSEV